MTKEMMKNGVKFTGGGPDLHMYLYKLVFKVSRYLKKIIFNTDTFLSITQIKNHYNYIKLLFACEKLPKLCTLNSALCTFKPV